MAKLQPTNADPVSQYTVTSATVGPFVVGFPFANTTDVKIAVGGITLSSGYSVSGTAAEEGGFTGGTVTLDTAISSTTVMIYLDPDPSRSDDYDDGRDFNLGEIDFAFDRQHLVLNALMWLVKRSLRQPRKETAGIGELPDQSTRALRFLGFDANGDPIAAAGTSGDLSPVTAFVNDSIFTLADAAALKALLTLGTAADKNTGLSGDAVPVLNQSNTWDGDQTVRSTDGGATALPVWTLFRDSASPAVADFLGKYRWLMRNDAAEAVEAAVLVSQILNAADGAESTQVIVRTLVAGTLADRLKIINGLVVGSPTGGDPGAGGVNAVSYKANGADLPYQTPIVYSPELTISVGGQVTWAHGLGASPRHFGGYLECISTDIGYEVGDRVELGAHPSNAITGQSVWANATFLGCSHFGTNLGYIANKDGAASTRPNEAKWRLYLWAIA